MPAAVFWLLSCFESSLLSGEGVVPEEPWRGKIMLGRTGGRLDELHGPRRGRGPSSEGVECLLAFTLFFCFCFEGVGAQAGGVLGPGKSGRLVALSRNPCGLESYGT